HHDLRAGEDLVWILRPRRLAHGPRVHSPLPAQEGPDHANGRAYAARRNGGIEGLARGPLNRLKEKNMLEEKAFYEALESARKPRGSGKHPFSMMWSEGKLSRQQLGRWAVQHYYYISTIPAQFAALYARMPDPEGREMIMENLVGEEPPHA